MAEIQSLLDGVIEEEIKNVKSLETGSEKKTAAIRDLSVLHKLRIEEIKAQTEAEEKTARREMPSTDVFARGGTCGAAGMLRHLVWYGTDVRNGQLVHVDYVQKSAEPLQTDEERIRLKRRGRENTASSFSPKLQRTL